MAWYDEAVFYHIYPLGLTGAPKQNAYEKPVHRLNTLLPWISHIRERPTTNIPKFSSQTPSSVTICALTCLTDTAMASSFLTT